MHSIPLHSKLKDKNGRATKLATSEKSEADIIDELYLAAYSRPPTDKENKLAIDFFAHVETTRQTATEDILWVLINSAEFVFNH